MVVSWFKADNFGGHAARFISKEIGVQNADHDWMVSALRGSQLRFRLKTNGTTSTLVSANGVFTTGLLK